MLVLRGRGPRGASGAARDRIRSASMAKIVKVQCTGAGRHVNEIDLEDVLGPDVIVYGNPIDTGRQIPAQIVRRCEVCDEGKVVVTREMIEQVF
jgi:hypothetical protein